MAFIKFSPEYITEGFTLLDNIFIREHLPYMPEEELKVYLTGLFICSQNFSDINTLEALSEALNLQENRIKDAFYYLEEKGLIEIIGKEPLEVRYLPLKKSVKAVRKFKTEKYSEFNRQLQDLYPDRMLTPNEYSEFYYFIESTKMSPEAMLMIVKYCIDYKGEKVRYPYILAVAANWARENILSVEAVETKLLELESDSENMRELYYTLGKKGTPSLSDLQEYMKWTKSWGFNRDSIMYAAETLKNKGNISKLDRLLDEYFRMDIFDINGMREYVKVKEELYDIAVTVNKALGLYYESLDNVVSTYISPWVNKGYDKDTLKLIADYCFKGSIRKLDGMNDVIGKFYKLGLISSESINKYLENLLRNDDRIKTILDKAGIMKNITNSDRNYYKIWSEEWGFSDEIIKYAAELATGRARAFAYINKTLSVWKGEGVDTLEKALKRKPYKEIADKGFDERNYTKDELNALFDNIDDLGTVRE